MSSIQQQIDALLDAYPDATHGPAHLVLADGNHEDHHLRWSLGLVKAAQSLNDDDLYTPETDRAFMDSMDWYQGEAHDALQATQALLEALLRIPEDARR